MSRAGRASAQQIKYDILPTIRGGLRLDRRDGAGSWGVATLGAAIGPEGFSSKYYEDLIEGETLRGIKELSSKQCIPSAEILCQPSNLSCNPHVSPTRHTRGNNITQQGY